MFTSRVICAARAAWYGATEGPRLRLARGRASGNNRLEWCWPYDTPLITCYVPTYNRVELLFERALPSMIGQTYRNLEIIVVAHGCTDKTAVYAESTGDSRVRVVEIPRKQTYKPTAENHWFASEVAPANAALKAARGAWIARIDDDDVWDNEHIATLLEYAKRGDYEFVSSAYRRRRDGDYDVVAHDGEDPPIGGHQTWLYRSYLRFMRYNPDCWRKSWNRVNDTDLADRFRKAGVRIGWKRAVTCSVYPRPGDTTVGLEAYRRAEGAIERQYAF